MKRSSLAFFQFVILFIGVAVLVMLVRFPLIEGRAKNLGWFDIYSDPLILYGYAASIAFFVALYNGFRLLGTIRQDKLFSAQAIQRLNAVRYCAIIFCVMIVAAGIYVRVFHSKDDDPAGFLAICIVISLVSIVVAIATTAFKNKLARKVY